MAPLAEEAESEAHVLGIPAQPQDQVGNLVDALGAGQLGIRLLEGDREVRPLAERACPADLRLAGHRDGVQALEVDAVRLGFRIGEGRPGLAHEPAAPLTEGVPQPQVIAAAGEVGLDEGAHVADAGGRAQVEVEAAGDDRELDARGLAGLFAAGDRDRRGDEAVVAADGVERVDVDHADAAADAQRGVGAGNLERAGELPLDVLDRHLGHPLHGLLDLRQPRLDRLRHRRIERALLDLLHLVVGRERQIAGLAKALLELRQALLLRRQALLLRFDQLTLRFDQASQFLDGDRRGCGGSRGRCPCGWRRRFRCGLGRGLCAGSGRTGHDHQGQEHALQVEHPAPDLHAAPPRSNPAALPATTKSSGDSTRQGHAGSRPFGHGGPPAPPVD